MTIFPSSTKEYMKLNEKRFDKYVFDDDKTHKLNYFYVLLIRLLALSIPLKL